MVSNKSTYKQFRKLLQPGAIVLSCSRKLLVGLSVDFKLFTLTVKSEYENAGLPFGCINMSPQRLSPVDEYIPIVGPAEINRVYVNQGEVRILLNQSLLVGERTNIVGDRVGYSHLRGVDRIILNVAQIDETCDLSLQLKALEMCVINRESVYGLIKWGYEPNLNDFENTLNSLINNNGLIRLWLTETSARTRLFTSILHNSLETSAGIDLSKVHAIIDELKYASRDNTVLLHPHDTGIRRGVEGARISGMEISPNTPYRFWYEVRTPRIFSGYMNTYWLREG